MRAGASALSSTVTSLTPSRSKSAGSLILVSVFSTLYQSPLSLPKYQRSADTFLGVPFNIASYALLLMMMAQVTGLQVGEFVHTLGDAHVYHNHFEQVRLQLTRSPRQLPRMVLNPDVKDIFSFEYDDFRLEDYDPYPHIPGVVSV